MINMSTFSPAFLSAQQLLLELSFCGGKYEEGLSNELLSALNCLFEPCLKQALELVDKKSIVHIQSTSGRGCYQEYTDWMNYIFRTAWKTYRVVNLNEEISSGILLVHLTNALYFYNLPVLYKTPSTCYEKMQNIELCLEILQEEGVRLKGVNSKDVADGNEEIILSLCSFLKRHFSVWRLLRGRRSTEQKTHNNSTMFEQIKSPLNPSIHFKQSYHHNERESQLISKIHEEGHCRDKKLTSCGENVLASTCYLKDDMKVFEWVSFVTGLVVIDYNSFSDGILLFELVNRLLPVPISAKIFYAVPADDRLQLLLDALYHDLNIDTCLAPGDIMTQQKFKQFQTLLQSLKLVYERHLTSCKSSKRVSWNPNTYAKNISREMYLGLNKQSNCYSWVKEMNDSVTSLAYDSQDLSLPVDINLSLPVDINHKDLSLPVDINLSLPVDINHKDLSLPVDINHKDLSLPVDINHTSSAANSETLQILKRTSLRSMRSVVDDISVHMNTLKKRAQQSGAGESKSITKSHDSRDHSNNNVDVKVPHIKPMSTSSKTFKSVYQPPRWSEILKEELQLLAECGKNKFIDDESASEKYEMNAPGSRGLAMFDQEIAAIFEDYSSSCDEESPPRTQTSTPMFILQSIASVPLKECHSNLDALGVRRDVDERSEKHVENTSEQIFETLPQVEVGQCSFEQSISKTSHRKVRKLPSKPSKWRDVTDMVRAQSKSPSGSMVGKLM